MKFRSANQVGENEILQTDICIAGAGAAGIALALELRHSRFRVMLLESGEELPSAEADQLNELEIAGHPLNVSEPVRRRGFGGTTRATYGRSVVFDPIDFGDRPWLAAKGWPISESELSRWYPRAAEILGLPEPGKLHREHWLDYPPVADISRHRLAVRIHRWGKHVDLGRAWKDTLAGAERVEVILQATAVNLESGADKNSISQLAVRGWNGGHFKVKARIFILACGGIENARLLLLSQGQEAAPSINWDAVGRHYMNHPRMENIARLHLDPALPNREETARRLTMHRSPQARGRLQFSFSPDENLQRQEGLLNVSSFFYAVSDEKARTSMQSWDDFRAGSAAGGSRSFSSLARLIRNLPTLADGAIHRIQHKPFRPDHLVVVDQCEQSPDPESRVLLGNSRDRFGNPLPRLDWRMDPATTISLRRLHRLMAGMCSGLGLGRFESRLLDDPAFVPPYADCAHPMGATRMSESERTGVVDSDCRVHGLRNLFIAGSSVFPVGGHANPTFTIIALATRLATLLKEELTQSVDLTTPCLKPVPTHTI